MLHKDYEYFNEHIINIKSRKEKIEILQTALINDDTVVASILIKDGITLSDISPEYDEPLIELAETWESTKILQLFENGR